MEHDVQIPPDASALDEIERRSGVRVFTDMHMRRLYSTDASIYQVDPIGVAVPEQIGQVPGICMACAELGVPMLPRGGGTSLAGQCVNAALVIDLSQHCHAMRSLDIERGRCDVEPGLTIDDLNDRIRAHGLFFAPDPSTARQANIGGCIGNNAAGVHSVLFGRTSENVLGIDVCLADGRLCRFDQGAAGRDPVAREITRRVVDVVQRHAQEIRDRFPRTRRRSSGYQLDVVLQQLEANDWNEERVDLSPLICGSEGTLAITLGATLRLRPIPRRKGLAVIAFSELDDAIAAVAPILDLSPSAVELLDDLIMDLARGNRECARYVDLLPDSDAKAVLFVEFFAEDNGSIAESFSELERLLPGASIRFNTDPIDMDNAWKLRKAGEPLLHAIEGSRKPLGFVEDNAVPVEHLGEFVGALREIITREGTIASYYAHASVGVLHVRPLLDLRDPIDEAAMHRIARDAAALVNRLGGVPSGEHGDGRARGPFIETIFGPELLGAFREIKAIFDPLNLLNPGNIVEPAALESISEHTRIKPRQKTIEIPRVDTYYNYEPEHGFGHAVELCNGAGVCRRKRGGTMCPSYQATLEERHSTRGRGNALRLAISGQLDLCDPDSGEPDFNDRATKQTLDLCLSCKGCKSECPSSVDIAKLKSEYLAQGYRAAGGPPLPVRMMSSIHAINRLGSIFPGLTNAINRTGLFRAMTNRTLDIHPRRSLPEFAAPIKRRAAGTTGKPRVIVLSDTFSTHNDPGITLATVRVLEAFGYGVGIECVSDLGRAAISLGNLEHAIRDARRTLDALRPLIEDERIRAFVIPEPSCLSAISDDWTDLKLDRDRTLIETLRAKAALPEAFLEALWTQHPARPAFKEIESRILLHAHCHQKALWGASSSSAIFERLYPDRIRTLDTGCCGLAGSFGYSARRFDLSMRIGELSLLPAVRSAGESDIIIAPGTSCRHQILDGTSRRAIHPIQALAMLLMD